MARDDVRLEQTLGREPGIWPLDRLIWVPAELKLTSVTMDLMEAIRVAPGNRVAAREIVLRIDDTPLKRWFIDVAQHAGQWRFEVLGGIQRRPTAVSVARRVPSRKLLRDLFQRDGYRCRYCSERVIGDREHFKRLAALIDVPELLTTGSNESRHGIYLMYRASHDHVVPHSQSGGDGLDNLVTACWPCQFGKYRFTLDELHMTAAPGPIAEFDDKWLSALARLSK